MLEKILAISGKPGLYKLISGSKRMVVVESLIDGKRIPAYTTDRVISLSDIVGKIDNEKFINGYLNYFSESKLSKPFWRKNIVIIYNSLYHREDILNLEKIFKELNYRQINLICEKDIINFNKKEVFMINDEIYRIFYINKLNT